MFLILPLQGFASIELTDFHCASAKGTLIDYAESPEYHGTFSVVDFSQYYQQWLIMEGRHPSISSDNGKYVVKLTMWEDGLSFEAITVTIDGLPKVGQCRTFNGSVKYSSGVYANKTDSLNKVTSPSNEVYSSHKKQKVKCVARLQSSDADQLAIDEDRYTEPKPCILSDEQKNLKLEEDHTELALLPIGTKIVSNGRRADYDVSDYDTSKFDFKPIDIKRGEVSSDWDYNRIIEYLSCTVKLANAMTSDSVTLPHINQVTSVQTKYDYGTVTGTLGNAVSMTLEDGSIMTCGKHKRVSTPITIADFRRILTKNKMQLQLPK